MERKGAIREMQPKIERGSSSRNAMHGWGIKPDAKDADRRGRRAEERELTRRVVLGEYDEDDEKDVATILADLADSDGDVEDIESRDFAAWMK